MRMYEKLCMLARVSRRTVWDSVANSTGVMVSCLQESHVLSKVMLLDLGRSTSTTDDSKYKGGFVGPRGP